MRRPQIRVIAKALWEQFGDEREIPMLAAAFSISLDRIAGNSSMSSTRTPLNDVALASERCVKDD